MAPVDGRVDGQRNQGHDFTKCGRQQDGLTECLTEQFFLRERGDDDTQRNSGEEDGGQHDVAEQARVVQQECEAERREHDAGKRGSCELDGCADDFLAATRFGGLALEEVEVNFHSGQEQQNDGAQTGK